MLLAQCFWLKRHSPPLGLDFGVAITCCNNRPEHTPGEPPDASKLCDCLRGALMCKDFTVINSVVEMLVWLDHEMGDESRCEGIEQRFRIRLIRSKCRFSEPTSGGWADLLVNFTFVDDPSKHVMELQVRWFHFLCLKSRSFVSSEFEAESHFIRLNVATAADNFDCVGGWWLLKCIIAGTT